MNSTLKQNLWKISPLGIAILIFLIGYIFRTYDPLALGICNSFYGEYCMDAVGIPVLALARWLIAAALIMIFVRHAILKRWSIFAISYLTLAAIAIVTAKVSAGGFDFPEKLFVADVSGILFLIITILWVIIHTIILRRKV